MELFVFAGVELEDVCERQCRHTGFGQRARFSEGGCRGTWPRVIDAHCAAFVNISLVLALPAAQRHSAAIHFVAASLMAGQLICDADRARVRHSAHALLISGYFLSSWWPLIVDLIHG
jgi:phosphoglycerol transferase MdoB-like AlkP superfamily enzyme